MQSSATSSPILSYKTITFDSEPRGAKVVFQGKVICESTSGEASVPLTYNYDVTGFKTLGKRAKNSAEMNRMFFDFILLGYESASESIVPNVNVWPFEYPSGVFHQFKRSESDTKLAKKEERVTKEAPGATQMEKSVIRWYFDSEPFRIRQEPHEPRQCAAVRFCLQRPCPDQEQPFCAEDSRRTPLVHYRFYLLDPFFVVLT